MSLTDKILSLGLCRKFSSLTCFSQLHFLLCPLIPHLLSYRDFVIHTLST